MKKVHLIEWGIITIGLLFGYKAFESFLSLILQVVGGFFMDNAFDGLLIAFLVLLLYLAGFITLFKTCRRLAYYLAGTEAQETVPFKINKESLLQVILISMCVFTILSNIIDIIYYLFEAFKSEAGRKNFYGEYDPITAKSTPIIISVLKIVLAIIVISYSKKIVSSFFRKEDSHELTLDTNPEKPDVLH
jgi:ABC-type Fe3+ transport system permease subunit